MTLPNIDPRFLNHDVSPNHPREDRMMAMHYPSRPKPSPPSSPRRFPGRTHLPSVLHTLSTNNSFKSKMSCDNPTTPDEIINCVRFSDEFNNVINKSTLRHTENFSNNINSSFRKFHSDIHRVDYNSIEEDEDIDAHLNDIPEEERNLVRCNLLVYVKIKVLTKKKSLGSGPYSDRSRFFNIMLDIVELPELIPDKIVDILIVRSGQDQFNRIVERIKSGVFKATLATDISIGNDVIQGQNRVSVMCMQKVISGIFYFIDGSLQSLFNQQTCGRCTKK